jgi:hypothetical protein
MHRARRFLLPLLLIALSGCAFDPSKTIVPPPPPMPEPDSPQNLMIRFEGVYELQSAVNYEALLTSDFRYTFSLASDPTLVDRYPNWGRDDEVESTRHLFEGFTTTTGETVPAASQIDMTLSGLQYGPDYTHPDSAEHYMKVVITSVHLVIDVPIGPSGTSYDVSGRHEFYLVRGDAAVLDPGQEARADRWYLRRWDDLSPGVGSLLPAADILIGAPRRVSASWGEVKAAAPPRTEG